MSGASAFDPLRYWEERHTKFANDHRNVGNITLTSAQNSDLPFSKAITLAHALGRHDMPRGARILDAGCGAGVITELLRLGGFDMSGFDSSRTAIAAAQAASSASCSTAALTEYKTTSPFDAVMCCEEGLTLLDTRRFQYPHEGLDKTLLIARKAEL